MTLFDASAHLYYDQSQMDKKRPLWFMRDCSEVDCLVSNAVALLPDADIRACAPFLRAFPSVFVAIADNEIAEKTASMLAENVLALTVLTPKHNVFGTAASVQEVYQMGGILAVDRLMLGAEEHPVYGLLNLADIEQASVPCSVLSGIRELDAAIGGFCEGELSVWTGKRGSGKSTFLGQTLLEAIDRGHHVCAYSGELAEGQFKRWLTQQAAGPRHIVPVFDSYTGKTLDTIPADIQKQIDHWWDGKFYLYDNSAGGDEDSILELFEFAVRRYGCSVFMVDNLMSARFSTMRDTDFYRAQSNFTGRLVAFAKKHRVHVHLVAHPRKTDDSRRLTNDDVGGSGDITNRADNVFSITRLSEEQVEAEGFQTHLQVLKNRAFGETASLRLNYDSKSRRFYKAGTGNANKRYGWENIGNTATV